MKSNLNADAQVILLLCSHLAAPKAADGKLKPLSPTEWNGLAATLVKRRLRPGQILDWSRDQLQSELAITPELADRLASLLVRGAQLAMEVERLGSVGVWALTRADSDYPSPLKERLGAAAPPVLFGAGDRGLLNQGFLAVVGSRDVDDSAAAFAGAVGRQCAAEGKVLVSGGARGVDRIGMDSALEAGGSVIGVLADNLERAIREPGFRKAIMSGRLVLLSAVHPKAPFLAANAMARNKLIYTLAHYGLVVTSSVERGGTRAGALEVLKSRWVPLFVRGGDSAPAGNQDLIQRGALPFPWDVPASGLASLLEERAASWGGPAGRKGLRPAGPEASAPSVGVSDLFPVVWPHIAAQLASWQAVGDLAKGLQTEPVQMRAWLERAVARGLAARAGESDRYALAGTEAEQQRFDIS